MPTLLLSARNTDDTQSLWRACVAKKWEVVRIHGWQVPSVPTNDLAVYGEPLFGLHVAQTLGLKLVEPPIDWLPQLSAGWRSRDVQLMSLAEARKISQPAFMKPAEEKCFEARIYSSGTGLPATGPLPENLPVLVQEIVEWTLEYRCFVLNRQLVTLSPYWRHGKIAKIEDGTWPAENSELVEATKYCERFIREAEVALPDAVVVDVGIIRNRGWAVVESNAAWASGIYGCDAGEVLRVLLGACKPILKIKQ